MSMTAVVHVALEIWGAVLCILAAICVYLGRNVDYEANRRLMVLQLCNALLLGMDVLAWAFRGREGALGWYMVRISNGMVFFCSYLIMIAYFEYAVWMIGREKGVSPVWRGAVYAVAAVGVVCCVVNQFNHMFYYFDENNFYHRSTYSWISFAIAIVGMLIFMGMLLHYRRRLSNVRLVVFASYLVLPFLAAVIQTFYYGLSLLNIAITISVLWAFLAAQVGYMLELTERTKELVEQERRNTDTQIKIVLSQIQPHFLYNVFNTIYYLCGSDPGKAQDAVNRFATYLRGNLNSLERSAPVPLETELEHVRSYLHLEQLRFGDELRVVYDIQAEGFRLPALSIQPLVENAVKYGVGKKPGGGTVTVASAEYDSFYEVMVADDGVGFDMEKPPDDARSHIGIENVRTRLKYMCNGTLEVTSESGYGTKAYIRLPK